MPEKPPPSRLGLGQSPGLRRPEISIPTPKGTALPSLGRLGLGLPGVHVHLCVGWGFFFFFNFYLHKKCETFTLLRTSISC